MIDKRKIATPSLRALDMVAQKAATGPIRDRAHERSLHLITALPQLGNLVLSRRKARGFSQQEFADLAGVGRRFISEIEAGKDTAQIGKVMKVLQALGLDLMARDR